MQDLMQQTLTFFLSRNSNNALRHLDVLTLLQVDPNGAQQYRVTYSDRDKRTIISFHIQKSTFVTKQGHFWISFSLTSLTQTIKLLSTFILREFKWMCGQIGDLSFLRLWFRLVPGDSRERSICGCNKRISSIWCYRCFHVRVGACVSVLIAGFKTTKIHWKFPCPVDRSWGNAILKKIIIRFK